MSNLSLPSLVALKRESLSFLSELIKRFRIKRLRIKNEELRV